jgi:hypothetical protein
MIENDVLAIIQREADGVDELMSLVGQFREGRDSKELFSLLLSDDEQIVNVGAYIASEIALERYKSEPIILRLRELSHHTMPSVRTYALRALYPLDHPKTYARSKKILQGADVSREGSLSVSFLCDEIASSLEFEKETEMTDDGEVVDEWFEQAYLEEFHTFAWVNKVGATMDDSLHSTYRVSWSTAKMILDELSPQVNVLPPDDRWILDEMVQVAVSKTTG